MTDQLNHLGIMENELFTSTEFSISDLVLTLCGQKYAPEQNYRHILNLTPFESWYIAA